jgi:hypothetical protein
MRRSVTWFLGFMLVMQLLHVINMLQVTYVQQKLASNEPILRALIGQYDGWTLAGIFAALSLVLFFLLMRTLRNVVDKDDLPWESPHKRAQRRQHSETPPPHT